MIEPAPLISSLSKSIVRRSLLIDRSEASEDYLVIFTEPLSEIDPSLLGR